MRHWIRLALIGATLCAGCSVLGVKVSPEDVATIAACAAEVDKATQSVVDSVPACKTLPSVVSGLTKK